MGRKNAGVSFLPHRGGGAAAGGGGGATRANGLAAVSAIAGLAPDPHLPTRAAIFCR